MLISDNIHKIVTQLLSRVYYINGNDMEIVDVILSCCFIEFYYLQFVKFINDWDLVISIVHSIILCDVLLNMMIYTHHHHILKPSLISVMDIWVSFSQSSV